MKRRLFFPIAVPLVLILFAQFNASFYVYAQGGDAKLKPEPKPTPTPRGGRTTKPATPTPPPAPVTPTLVFGQELKDRLDAKASGKGAAGTYFEEYILNAKSEDLLTFRLESESSSLGLQLFDKDKAEVAVAKGFSAGEFKIGTASGAVPSDGEYRVRVTGEVSGRSAVPFALKVNRIGLTPNAYTERFQKIYSNYHEFDQASVDETLVKLEDLGRDDTSRPTTFELLGIIYLYKRKDFGKAEQAMEQAIKANGAAVIKISFDHQWRRMVKLRSGDFGFEDARAGWLRIRPGQLLVTDTSNKTLATLSGVQIKEMTKIVTATNNLVTITAENVRKPYVFAPGTLQQAEADLVIKLIQNHVMKRTN